MNNYFIIYSVWKHTGLEYSEDLTTSFDITTFIKVWDIIKATQKDKIQEDREVIKIYFSEVS